MSSMRKTALVAGVFYLITFIDPHPRPLRPREEPPGLDPRSGAHTGVLVGGFLEVIVALAGIGTAVTCTRSSSGRTKRLLGFARLGTLKPA